MTATERFALHGQAWDAAGLTNLLLLWQVVEGMDLVKQLAALPHVESKAGSPFFQCAPNPTPNGLPCDGAVIKAEAFKPTCAKDWHPPTCCRPGSAGPAANVTCYLPSSCTGQADCCGPGRIAKAVGDRRADVAAKGFGRPYQRITIIDSGIPS